MRSVKDVITLSAVFLILASGFFLLNQWVQKGKDVGDYLGRIIFFIATLTAVLWGIFIGGWKRGCSDWEAKKKKEIEELNKGGKE